MKKLHFILLPGLHGNDELWPPLLDVMPSDIPKTIVNYPADRVLSRAELISLIEQAAPPDVPLVVIGESFSGPLAVEFAARHCDRVRALILSATFVAPPLPRWFCRFLAFAALYLKRPLYCLRGRLPDRIADVTVGRVAKDALRDVEPEIIASRLEMIGQTDCSGHLLKCRIPILYLQAAHDIVVHPHCLRRIQDLRPDVQVKVVNCSHMLFQRRPAETWSAIESLIAEG